MQVIASSVALLINPHHLAELSILVVLSVTMQSVVGLFLPVTFYSRIKHYNFARIMIAFSITIIWLVYLLMGLAVYNPVVFVIAVILGAIYPPKVIVPLLYKLRAWYRTSWLSRAMLSISS